MKLFFSQRPSLTSDDLRHQPRSLGFWRECLLLTSAIAIAAGIGFGAAIRFHRPAQAGSTFLHSEQSFPSRQDWPIFNSEQ